MSNKIYITLAVAGAISLHAQSLNHKIDFPKDSPVSLLSEDFGNSNATARGANLIDVNAALSLRNSGQKRIRSMTLMVSAQDAAGKGSVSVPTLDAGPGETFSIRIDTRLVRPLTAGNPVVEVTLDGVLFDDLSFYGPDVLHLQRTMTMWELEAQRDRKYFKSLLASGGAEGLGKEMLSSLARQGDRSQSQRGVQMVRGRATNIDAERETQFAFLDIPESPVEASGGRGADRGRLGGRAPVRSAEPLQPSGAASRYRLDRQRSAGPRVSGGFHARRYEAGAESERPGGPGCSLALRPADFHSKHVGLCLERRIRRRLAVDSQPRRAGSDPAAPAGRAIA